RPAEIVEQCNAGRIGTYTNRIANSFVHCANCHGVSVVFTQLRAQSIGHYQPGIFLVEGAENGGITRSLLERSHEWLHYAGALHLVIVLANNLLAATYVVIGQELR